MQSKQPQDKPLMTQKLRDQEQQLKELKYPKTMIRVKFKNEYVFQATFYSGDSVELLYNAVRKVVDAEEFELYTSPPKEILPRNKSFSKLKLAPATMVYITNGNLKPDLIRSAVEFPLPPQIEIVSAIQDQPEIETFNEPRPTEQKKEPKKGVPKWLKL